MICFRCDGRRRSPRGKWRGKWCGKPARAPLALSFEIRVQTPTPLQRALQDAQSGRIDAAIASVRTLLRIQPKNADALQMLGLFLTQVGQPQQAIAQLERAVAIAPNIAGYRNNLGNALMGSGRNKEAVDQFRAAVRLDARDHLASPKACPTLLHRASDAQR